MSDQTGSPGCGGEGGLEGSKPLTCVRVVRIVSFLPHRIGVRVKQENKFPGMMFHI